MIIKRIGLRDDHVREVSPQGITPEEAGHRSALGICGEVVPVRGDFYAEVAGAAMNRKPAVAGGHILAVLDKVVAATERTKALVEHPLMELDAPAEVGDEAPVDARGLVDEVGRSRTGLLIPAVQKTE